MREKSRHKQTEWRRDQKNDFVANTVEMVERIGINSE
jgi:hypothetical protein